MKKSIYLLLLLLIIPVKVNAKIDLEKIHDDISKDNELIINSIPISYYQNTKNFDECISYESYLPEEEQVKSCLSNIYGLVVNSEIRKNYKLEKDINYYVNSCDIDTNICRVVVSSKDEYLEEEYKIKVNEKYDEDIFKKANKFADNLKNKYYLADMSYINQIINYTNELGFFDAVIYDNSKILNIFPEFKSNLEKNPDFNYIPVSLGVGGSPIMYGSASTVIIYYDDVVFGISEGISYNTMELVFVPDTTENTEEAYANAAKKRIEEYLNNDEYEISLTYDYRYKEDYCTEYDDICNVSRELNYIFEDEEKYIASPYILKINDKEYFVGIVPVSEEKIIELEVKSFDYENDISIETNDSSVPLDITLRVKDKSKEYGVHGYDRVYDINLYSLLKDGYVTRIYDGVKVRIPLSDNYKHNKVDVWHIKEDGTKGEKYNANVIEIEGKKYAEFITDHFSMYGIEAEVSPQTYDGIKLSFIIFTLGISLSIITLKYNRKILETK